MTEPHDLVQDLFGAWLSASNLHGCSFASWAAKKGRIRYSAFFEKKLTRSTIEQLNGHFKVASENDQLALAVFPSFSDEEDVVELLNELCAHDRWCAQLREEVRDILALDLRWQSSATLEASAMGFAPLPVMPVARRAPYVAIALWPTQHANRFRKKPESWSGVGDMAHDLVESKYRVLHKQTRARVSAIRDTLKNAGVLTGVSFCVSSRFRKRLMLG